MQSEYPFKFKFYRDEFSHCMSITSGSDTLGFVRFDDAWVKRASPWALLRNGSTVFNPSHLARDYFDAALTEYWEAAR